MTVDLHVLCEQFRELQPPQMRDRLIFEAVAVKQRSQTEVAREHGISQPRVAQIVVEVGLWLARVLPQAFDQTPPDQRMVLASFLAEARLMHLEQEVMTAWRLSTADKVVVKEMPRKDGMVDCLKTTIPQGGKVGLINASIRLTLALSRLSGVDTSGRTQRLKAEAAAAARKAKEQQLSQAEVGRPFRAVSEVDASTANAAGVPSYEPEIPLIAQTCDSAAFEEPDSAQDEPLSLDTRFRWTLEQEHETIVNRLMKDFREDEEPVTVSDEELRAGCEILWEDGFRAKAEEFHRMKHVWFPYLVPAAAPSEPLAAAAPPLEQPSAAADMKPLAIHEPLEQVDSPDLLSNPLPQLRENTSSRLPRSERRRLRREWERRRSQASRRQFLKPLAVG